MKSIQNTLINERSTWLITGCAGFIGSHIAEKLISTGQRVVGLDNLSTGLQSNIELLESLANQSDGSFTFHKESITNYEKCLELTKNTDYVIHQAALGSVPRSIENPIASFESNILGFINILEASRQNNVKSFVFASSSSVYGDNLEQPKKEENTGNALSPYACSKITDEIIGLNYHFTYGMNVIGLRYFNVFGSRQNPEGPYAAVIPKWIEAFLNKKPVEIFGDGTTSRDFCFIQNTVEANILAALNTNGNAFGKVYNIACSESTSLNEIYQVISTQLKNKGIKLCQDIPIYKDFRKGDIKDSLASISRAEEFLNYKPLVMVNEGLKKTVDWYLENL